MFSHSHKKIHSNFIVANQAAVSHFFTIRSTSETTNENIASVNCHYVLTFAQKRTFKLHHGKVVLLRVNEVEPRSQQPGYDFVLKQAFERNHIQQRFIDDAGVEIPCLDSMHIRKNLESNETLQNRNGYPQRCYVFLDDMFNPSSLQRHLDQLKTIVDICQNICLNNDNGKILNSWNPWSIECDLSTTTTQSFNEPYIFPSVDTVATENSTVNLCRAIYGTLDYTNDAPENVIIYEFDDIVKSFFRQRPNGLGYSDHAIIENWDFHHVQRHFQEQSLLASVN
ncbi:hypothetical protein IV203_018549 [Nitzschia inconspicua]|uniref:Uncharacterized protein n=1 Tax=Nitzschia inconspicua TaxID=303405 RepID=A0A9K3M5E6_9STRA|nr:hypothetical protein IV203_033413 [Nitzschia inconspicua]KAG7372406.1 hypothetical protein IV203_018549 [Nitzschia inconspicua]